MRLLFIIYGSPQQISGGYLYDRKVIEYLRDQGVQVDYLELPLLPYLLCPLHSLYGPLRRLFRGRSDAVYDCIIVDELTHPSVFLLASRRAPKRLPLVVLLHHLKAREQIGPLLKLAARFMEKRLLKHCDALITNSNTTADTAQALLQNELSSYICVPGCDTFGKAPEVGLEREKAKAAPAATQPLRLLVTGNIIPRKGHDLLMEVLGGLSDLAWELQVVGAVIDPRYRRKVDRLARRYGLEERVHYTGLLSPEALHRQYLEADIFVFPSRYEGYGISLAEAIRAHLPFVAFASGAITELTGGRGSLVAAGDLHGFRHQLRLLIADPSIRRQSAVLSRSLAGQLPTWRQTGMTFFRALEEIIDEVFT
jgi:glycosyltransferase involved in cell wall biosynthesis